MKSFFGNIYRHLVTPDHFFRNILLLKHKHVKYGSNLQIHGKILINGSGNIVIGNNVIINSRPTANSAAGGIVTSFNVYEGANLIIGNRVGISHAAITAQCQVVIDDDVLIGSNCMICDTDFHPLDTHKRVAGDRATISKKPVHISQRVFIGARSIILKGVSIGENSIIGAGSVVTKNIPANQVWAGNPARFIRYITNYTDNKVM